MLRNENNNNEESASIKLIVVGDPLNNAKKRLVEKFTGKTFPSDYLPTSFDDYDVAINLGGKNYNLIFRDTTGNEDYERLRALSYINRDIVLLIYSIHNRESFEQIPAKWYPEASHYCPSASLILVALDTQEPATKMDVTSIEGEKLAEEIRATFVSCSIAEPYADLKKALAKSVRSENSLEISAPVISYVAPDKSSKPHLADSVEDTFVGNKDKIFQLLLKLDKETKNKYSDDIKRIRDGLLPQIKDENEESKAGFLYVALAVLAIKDKIIKKKSSSWFSFMNTEVKLPQSFHELLSLLKKVIHKYIASTRNEMLMNFIKSLSTPEKKSFNEFWGYGFARKDVIQEPRLIEHRDNSRLLGTLKGMFCQVTTDSNSTELMMSERRNSLGK